MPKMTPQDAAMLKILRNKYGASVYPTATPKPTAKVTKTTVKVKKK